MNCQVSQDDYLSLELGVLSEAEAEVLLAHLATGCPKCVAAAAEASEVVGSIPLAGASVTPPSGALSWLMAHVRAEQAGEKVVGTGVTGGMSAVGGMSAGGGMSAVLPVNGQAGEGKGPSRMRIGPDSGSNRPALAYARRGFGFGTLAAAAGVGLTIGAVAVYLNAADTRRELQATRDAMVSMEGQLADASRLAEARSRQVALQVKELDELKQKVEVREAAIVDLQRQLEPALLQASLMQSPDLKVVALGGSDVQPGAKAHLFWNTQTGQWKLVGSDLAKLPEGRQYALWFITAEGRKYPAGLLNFDEAQLAVAQSVMPKGLGEIAAVAVSDEPTGGSPQPTGKIHVIGKL